MPRWALLLVLPLLLASPHDAQARRGRYFKWTNVEARSGDDAKRVSRTLRRLLQRASKRAKWGKSQPPVELRARVTKLAWEERSDVLRVSVTVVARIKDGKGARSFIRVGGHPRERRKLERQALKIVANGLVTRLAELSRQR